jgi:hypothetical protein
MIAMKLSVPLAACLTLFAAPLAAQQANMSFFVTSNGPGKGGDLGGLAGADKHCQDLAASVGAGGKTWHAYLSTQGAGAVNARDRIGKGPWQNAKGVVIATSIEDLHSDNNKISKENSVSEKGEMINGYGDKPNRHDILTGSQADGTAFPPDKDMTCKNYTSSTQGAVMFGHSDRNGPATFATVKSWNSSHASIPPRDGSAPGEGCSQKAMRGTGGDGLLYCFAVN